MDAPSSKKMKTMVSGDVALTDAIDRVCHFLNIKDLLNVALVCKSWHDAASREISKRGPEIVLLPDLYSNQINNEKFHPYDFLNNKPHVALLFVGPSLREREYKKGLEIRIVQKYRKYFPHYLVAIGVDESQWNEKEVNSCPGLLGDPNGILGLFLPSYRNLQYKLTYQTASAFDFQNPEKFIIDLKPVYNGAKSTLIIFCNSRYGMINGVLNLLKDRFAQKMYTLWGGCFDDKLKAVYCKGLEDQDETTAAFGLNIMGSSIESWSTVIDCTIEKDKFDEKLRLFKDKLHLKRCTLGLACGPRYVEVRCKPAPESYYRNSFEMMSSVKNILPNITFISVFNYGYHGHFGVDSTIDDNDQELSTQMSLSLMIITYA